MKKKYLIKKETGIAVFVDNTSRKFRNTGSDVFIDSLIPDCFIPYRFKNPIINKETITTALLSNKHHRVHFFHLIRDCEEAERKSSIEIDCLPLNLDQDIDNYLKSKRIYVEPVMIHYVNNSHDEDYLKIHNSLTIKYNDNLIELKFNKGSFDVLQTDVLQYEWKN